MAFKLKTKTFDRWQRKTELTDTALIKAIEEMANGLVDADLGGNLFKKRVGLAGRGKRGGARTLVATNRGDRWIFLYGFPKNERSNITETELRFLQSIAQDVLSASDDDLKKNIEAGRLLELTHEEE